MEAGTAVLTTLAAGMMSTDSAFTAADPTFLGVGMVVQIDSELMLITAISGSTVSVMRGYDASTAAAHNSGTDILIPFDQRGLPRISDGVTDIGAYQTQYTAPVVTGVAGNGSTAPILGATVAGGVVTITTDDHHTLQEFRASLGAQWTFLSDPGRTVQQDLDIQEYTDPEHNPMIPHTLVLKPGLVIHSIYNGYWFWGRPSFYDLWRDLRAATAEIRPDWDLSTPGLRQAWDAHDYSKFHGWDRRAPGSMPTSYDEASKA